MDHPEQLADLLVGTVLAGRRVLAFDPPDGAVRFLAVEIAEDELVPSWRAGHRLLEQTGHWPVVGNPYPQARRNDVATALAADDPFSSTSMTAHRCAAGRDRLEAMRRSQAAVWDETADDARLEYELSRTRSVYGRAPDAAEARREAQANDSVYILDRWLMNWEERQRHQPSTRSDRYLNWLWDGGPPVFLPARRSAEVCVYLDFWGEQASPGATPAAIAQIIDYWAMQYDAQLIANWGTMLQFVVARPPDNLEQARPWPGSASAERAATRLTPRSIPVRVPRAQPSAS